MVESRDANNGVLTSSGIEDVRLLVISYYDFLYDISSISTNDNVNIHHQCVDVSMSHGDQL